MALCEIKTGLVYRVTEFQDSQHCLEKQKRKKNVSNNSVSCKLDDLNLITRTHIKEERGNSTKLSDLHMCAVLYHTCTRGKRTASLRLFWVIKLRCYLKKSRHSSNPG